MFWPSRVALVVKNLPANAGDVRDVKRLPRNESVAQWRFETQGKIHKKTHIYAPSNI